MERFTSISARGAQFRLPPRNRLRHGRHLRQQLEFINERANEINEERQALGIDVENGICLQFVSASDFDLKFDSLEAVRSGIELLSVQKINDRTVAAVYVPDGKLNQFINKIEAYTNEETRRGVPKNKKLVESISAIRTAAIEAFWTDERDQLPEPEEAIWWEVWLRAGQDKEAILETFRIQAPKVDILVGDKEIRFIDRTVLLAHGSRNQISRSIELLNTIAELRRAKDTPQIFLEMPPQEQAEWVEEALARIQYASPHAPVVCLLDTGVNRGHPLLEHNLAPDDMHSYDPNWGVADNQSHGTEMAGLALYGDLMNLFSSTTAEILLHRLESVKILPPRGANEPDLYGAITIESVSRAEVTDPHRSRAICMTVTSTENRDRGRPSSWSAAIDKLTSGADDDIARLFIIAAGNTDSSQRHEYPNSNIADEIHDPGQAWNALTIGAYTEKDFVNLQTYPGWRCLAPRGGLSPSSCTSTTWGRIWPIKPDIVLEGGNMALNPGTGIADYLDSLSLLTTHSRTMERLLTVTRDTSAAAVQAARMAAIIQATYPNFWPETIRALLVHSAEWTPEMQEPFQPLQARGDKETLLKFCGFGVPSLSRTLRSASNSLTLIIQDTLQPYDYDREGKRHRTRDMHIHEIPWPTDVLRELGETDVKMRVSLSYFIEPNPGQRGWKYRHRYSSHGLRFEVKTATETLQDFRERINTETRNEEFENATPSGSEEWYLGPKLRSRGSLHSDWWEGTATDLADRGFIGIYPVIGWWRERHQFGRWNQLARYSLIVTIEAPEVDVDIYTPVATQVQIPVEVGV